MSTVGYLLVLSIAALAISGAAQDNNGDCKQDDDKSAPKVNNLAQYLGSCSCGFTQYYGCFLDRNKPGGLGCTCLLTGSIDCPWTRCYGRLVSCTDPQSQACADSGKTKADCLQGVEHGIGNCNGYPDVDIKKTSAITVRPTTVTVSAAQESECHRWCQSAPTEFYCCEKASINPSPVTTKPGQCPEVRSTCPPYKSGGRPIPCSIDGGCPSDDKCCYDVCVRIHICKRPIF